MIAITRVSDVPCLIYWGYNPFTNHFLTSWDIQVGFLEKICSPCSPSAGFLLQSSLSSLYTVETYQMNSIPSWVFYLLKKKCLVSKNHLRIARKGRVNTIRYIWVFPKIMVPPIINFNWVFHYKPSILGYPYFCKHPYTVMLISKLKSWYWKNNFYCNVDGVIGPILDDEFKYTWFPVPSHPFIHPSLAVVAATAAAATATTPSSTSTTSQGGLCMILHWWGDGVDK